MLRENKVKQKIEAGELSLGVAITWPYPDLLEYYGHLGFEWAFIDAEHGGIGLESFSDLVRACYLSDMVPIVRVPQNNPATILGYLEAGAMGIVAPHVRTADDARALVSAVRYSPAGIRSAGSGSRHNNLGLAQPGPDYFAWVNDHLIVDCLIEDVEGVQNLDKILAVEGVDVAGIGPGDLSMSMGLPGGSNHPEVVKIVQEAEARIVASGTVLDYVAAGLEDAKVAADNGSLLIAVSVTGLIASSGRAFLAEF